MVVLVVVDELINLMELSLKIYQTSSATPYLALIGDPYRVLAFNALAV